MRQKSKDIGKKQHNVVYKHLRHGQWDPGPHLKYLSTIYNQDTGAVTVVSDPKVLYSHRDRSHQERRWSSAFWAYAYICMGWKTGILTIVQFGNQICNDSGYGEQFITNSATNGHHRTPNTGGTNEHKLVWSRPLTQIAIPFSRPEYAILSCSLALYGAIWERTRGGSP